jgi:MFS transporter, DHA1 family, multidrug resistance protein
LSTLPETLTAGRRSRESLVRAVVRYGELLRHRRLLGYMGAGGFFYGGMFAYIAGTPFAYITYHHVPPQLYGLLFGIGIVGIIATNFANSIAGALADFPERAGAVSALVGAIQYGSGIIGSALVGAFADGTPRPMGWVIALAAIGSLLCAGLLVSARHRVPAHASDWHGAAP